MKKSRATLIHLALSACIVTIVVAVMVFIWYPAPLFAILGGYGLLLLIAGVDITLGPLLTFIVFKSGKKGMTFDLIVIGVCQLAALIYGLYTVAEVRPAFIVFAKDRFELVRATDIPAEKYATALNPKFKRMPWFGPQFIGVKFPSDPNEQLQLITSSLSGEPDIYLLPKYFDDIEASNAAIIKSAKSLEILQKLNPTKVDEIANIPKKMGLPPSEIGFVVMRAIRADVAVLVNTKTGKVLSIEVFTPW
jgi:hypothetical protein